MNPSSMPFVTPDSLLISYGLPGMVLWLVCREILPPFRRILDRISKGEPIMSGGAPSGAGNGTPQWYTINEVQRTNTEIIKVLADMRDELRADRQERQIDRQMQREATDALLGAIRSTHTKP